MLVGGATDRTIRGDCAPHFQIQRRQKTCGLGQRFLAFRFGIGIGHDARADVEIISPGANHREHGLRPVGKRAM
jgi:hypothetical protein